MEFDSNDPYASRGETQIHLDIKRAMFDRGDGFFPSDAIDIDPVLADAPLLYLVVVRYHDGDSFHNTTGNYHFGPVFASLEEARAWNPESGTNYKPWRGYFAGGTYDSVEYWCFDMAGGGDASQKD